MALQPLRVQSTSITGTDGVRLQGDRVDPVEAYARAQADLREVFTDRAATVQFGADALSLARSSETSNPDATAPDLFDTLDLELGLFAYETPSPAESGFFRSPNATSSESFLARQSVDGGLESTFPRAAANDALESTSPQVSAATRPRAEELSALQQQEVELLAQNDRQARADQRALRATAGGHSAGVQLRSEVGPNGQRYVVAAEVPLDVTPVPGDPAATLRKMEVIIRAAAAGSPSLGDRNISVEAEQLARRARAELAAERYAEAQEY